MAASRGRLADRFTPLTLPPLSAHACVRLSGSASLMRQGSLPLPARGEGEGVRGFLRGALVTPGALLIIAVAASPRPLAADDVIADCPYYGGDAGGSRYSPLTQIDRSNVGELKVSWEYHTGDISDGSDNRRKSEFEATPIVVDGTMYVSTPFNRVVALDPETGREKWSFDPKIDLHAPYSEGLVNRGVGLWTDPGKGEGEACRRVFLATIDARLFALDATAGTLCTDFGAVGQIDLTRSIANITRRGEYEDTSAPAIAGDLVIVGSSIADNDRVASPSGVVRAL